MPFPDPTFSEPRFPTPPIAYPCRSMCRMCYWCYWGWPVELADIHDESVERIEAILEPLRFNKETFEEVQTEPPSGFSALHFGPGHVLWEDENWDCADYCLKECDGEMVEGWVPAAVEVLRDSLRRVIALPDHLKREPEGYSEDETDPKDFPPPWPVRHYSSPW